MTEAEALGIVVNPVAADFLASLPTEIAATIKGVLPQLRDCKAVAGRFNVDELKDASFAAPAVLVSLIKWSQDGGRAGQFDWKAQIAAFIVTKDTMGLTRDVAAANIAQAISALAVEGRWGLGGCGPAMNIQAENLVSASSRKAAASLFVVTWMQPFVLDAQGVQAITPGLYVGQAPLIGFGHEDDYTQIGVSHES